MSTQSLSKWSIDAMHSEVEFKVKHLMISTVTGKFSSYSGELNQAMKTLLRLKSASQRM